MGHNHQSYTSALPVLNVPQLLEQIIEGKSLQERL